jgi:hypothetical protein
MLNQDKISKIQRGYLWRGRKEAKGGHCLVVWTTVTRPKEMGGLGIADLITLGRALSQMEMAPENRSR